MKQKLDCSECSELLVSKDTLEEYFEKIDRGGLTVPSNLIFFIGKLCLYVTRQLISKKFESMFFSVRT